MKAVVYQKYGSPDVLQLKEVPKPEPRENELLIKVRATTVTAADVRTRSFTIPAAVWLPARLILGITKPRKKILGAELAGEVEAVGSHVSRFKVGDAVFAATLPNFGAYAEYACLSEEVAIAKKPTNLSYEEAAALPIGARAALHYLQKAAVQPGQTVLVYGASGSVGSYAVQLAKHFGATVTGVCSTANVDMVKALGADKVVDYTVEDFSATTDRYDVIFEAVDKSSFAACRKRLKEGGIYVNVVLPTPTPQTMWASLTRGPKIMLGDSIPETAEYLVTLKELAEAGAIKPVIDRRYRLDEIVEAHRYVDTGRKKGNVVITP